MLIITNDVQSDGIWLWWLGGNLTLVDTSISLLKLVSLTETETALTTHLDIFDQENPLVLSVVFWRESLVGGEGLLSSRQNMDITMSHPGHLEYFVYILKEIYIFRYSTFCVGFKFFTTQVRNAVFPRMADTFCGWRKSKWVRDFLR